MAKYKFDAFLLDTTNRLLKREGIEVAIRAKSFQVLAVLVEAGQDLVTFNKFRDDVWEDDQVSKEMIREAVKVLRRSLGENGKNPKVVLNKPGHGYYLGVEVELLSDTIENDTRHLVGRSDVRHEESLAVDTTLQSQDVPQAISAHLCNFNAFIADRTRGFSPRKFVFQQLDDFLSEQLSGYFIIDGHPGMGKSSLLAQLVATRRYIHHFNIAAESRNKPEKFLANVCAQLIVHYRLPFSALPENAADGPDELLKLLEQASRKQSQEQKIVIAIDALDEVDWRSGTGNVLYLPTSLPDNVYMVVTTRPLSALDPRSQLFVSPSKHLTLDKDAKWQRDDVQKYIASHLDMEGIRNWIVAHKLTPKTFVELLLNKSEANFMYLRHVLPALGKKRAFGPVISLEITANELPQGLQSYYKQHWTQMQTSDPVYFDQVCRPVLCQLSAAKELVPASFISKWTKIELSQVRRVLENWNEFLCRTQLSDGEYIYQIYHRSFQEFLFAIGGESAKEKSTRSGLRKYGRNNNRTDG